MVVAVAVAVILSVIAILLSLVCLHQLGEMYLVSAGRLSVDNDGLAPGEMAPRTTVLTQAGARDELVDLAMRNAGLSVVFSGLNCSICSELRSQLEAVDPAEIPHPIVFVYDQIPPAEIPSSHAAVLLVTRAASPARRAKWKVRVTPFAFELDAEGAVLRKGLVNRVDELLPDASAPVLPHEHVS